jgi:carbon monoxide dehydrogenase subunit G
MEINGDYTFKAPIDKVWQIMMSREALKAALPGCEKFEEVEPNTFDVTMKVGVASIKGTYNGRITITDTEEPKHYKLIVSGQGGSGFLNGEGIFDLEEQSEGDEKQTLVTYKGTANVGGTLAGIGARMLSPVAKKLAGDFFKKMDSSLQEKESAGEATEAAPS